MTYNILYYLIIRHSFYDSFQISLSYIIIKLIVSFIMFSNIWSLAKSLFFVFHTPVVRKLHIRSHSSFSSTDAKAIRLSRVVLPLDSIHLNFLWLNTSHGWDPRDLGRLYHQRSSQEEWVSSIFSFLYCRVSLVKTPHNSTSMSRTFPLSIEFLLTIK